MFCVFPTFLFLHSTFLVFCPRGCYVISAVWCLGAVKFILPFALHTVGILMGVSTGWMHVAKWPCKDRRSPMSASFLCIILSGFASSQQGAARRCIYSVRTRNGVETGDECGESWGLSGRVEIDVNCRYSAIPVPCGGSLPLLVTVWTTCLNTETLALQASTFSARHRCHRQGVLLVAIP